jgi:hypothetical protein
MNKKPYRKIIKKLPFEDQVDRALKEAVAEALAEHKAKGNPIAIWRDGKSVWIPPDEIRINK